MLCRTHATARGLCKYGQCVHLEWAGRLFEVSVLAGIEHFF